MGDLRDNPPSENRHPTDDKGRELLVLLGSEGCNRNGIDHRMTALQVSKAILWLSF